MQTCDTLLGMNFHAARGRSEKRRVDGRWRLSRSASRLFLATAFLTGILCGQNHDLGYEDTPILPGLPYRVHDPKRPHPPVVSPAKDPGGAPSDAIVLFNGKDLSEWHTTKDDGGAGNSPWKVGDGYFEVVPKAGNLATNKKFGNFQLHIEWASPTQITGTSQERGNSGVFLMGKFEIQVLDSYHNPTYADGQAGSIYGQWPPLANAVRPTGEWNSYDIVFEAPRFAGGKLLEPAYITLFLNGILLHNRKAAMGPTLHRELAHYEALPAEDSLVLQDHGNRVRYRNVWIRRLSSYDLPEK
jgi:hypothetical protein